MTQSDRADDQSGTEQRNGRALPRELVQPSELQMLSEKLGQEPRVTQSHVMPSSMLRAARLIREELEALRNELDSVIASFPENGKEPVSREWERIAERLLSVSVRTETEGRRCRTAARRAHTEQR